MDEYNNFDEINALIESEQWEDVLQWAIERHDTGDPEVGRKVIECYELCAAQNMPVASLNLGTFYYTGRFVPLDYKKAFRLYKVAADAGERRALCNCGYCFYYGRHQEADPAEAFLYFTAGALLYDDANCLYKLGDMYLKGSGAVKNEVYAFKLYTRALDRCQENEEDAEVMADAQLRVGECLLHGKGTARNVEEANVLLSLAVLNFYKKRKTDPFAARSLARAKKLVAEAQELLDKGEEEARIL